MGRSASRRRAAAERHALIRSKQRAAPIAGDAAPRFVADVMVGRLARWMRIAGFDVLYSNRYTDDELVTLSRRQDRILLSRDTRLLVRKSVARFIYLESDDVQEQLRQVLERTPARPEILSRCLECNALLDEIARERVRGSVPPYVFDTQTRFKVCPTCRKVFWAGTHRHAVLRALERLSGKPP